VNAAESGAPPRRASPDVALAAAGDVAAFERLYRAHATRVRGLARRLLGTTDADDATQEIFIRAWRRLHTFRGTAGFETWLFRLAVHALWDRRKRLRVVAGREVQDESVDEAAPPLSTSAMDCNAAVLRLPDGARQVLVLHDIEGHTHQEIAELLGIAAGTSKSQLHRARALLREDLSRPRGGKS